MSSQSEDIFCLSRGRTEIALGVMAYSSKRIFNLLGADKLQAVIA